MFTHMFRSRCLNSILGFSTHPPTSLKMIFARPLAGAALLLLGAESVGAAVMRSRAGAGCGIVQDFKGDTKTGESIKSDEILRTYDVYLPPNYDEVRLPAEIWGGYGIGGPDFFSNSCYAE